MSDRLPHDDAEITHDLTHYSDAFANQPERPLAGWHAALQERAIAHFLELGFPSRRLEAWRETNVAPIAKQRFQPACGAHGLDLANLELPSFGGSRLVFVDGRFAAHASQLADDAALEFSPLAEHSGGAAPARGSALSHFGTLVDSKDDGFSALNTAFANDAAIVTLKRGRALSAPLQIVFVSRADASAAARPRASFPRVLIVAEPDSAGVVVQDHISLGSGATLSCAVCEIVIEDRASLEMLLVQREADTAFHIARQRVRQQRDSRFSLHTLNLAGALVRNDLEIELADEGADCSLSGLYLGQGHQHVDNHTVVDHAMPRCQSRELYKGVLADRARGVFRGRVRVRPGAQRTRAEQQNRNLLLGRRAQVDTQPQLEIYADDVACNHGSSIGQLDQEALFFLRARGLDEAAARVLLTAGFVAQIAQSIANPRVREWATAAVGDHLETLFDAGGPQ